MSWSDSQGGSGGRRKRARRWVTDRAREIAERQAPEPPAKRWRLPPPRRPNPYNDPRASSYDDRASSYNDRASSYDDRAGFYADSHDERPGPHDSRASYQQPPYDPPAVYHQPRGSAGPRGGYSGGRPGRGDRREYSDRRAHDGNHEYDLERGYDGGRGHDEHEYRGGRGHDKREYGGRRHDDTYGGGRGHDGRDGPDRGREYDEHGYGGPGAPAYRADQPGRGRYDETSGYDDHRGSRRRGDNRPRLDDRDGYDPPQHDRRERPWHPDEEDKPPAGRVPKRPIHVPETADTPGEGDGPRKLTVVRVAAWRGRELSRQGIAAFRRAATAGGADRSGLTGLTFPVMASFAADAAVAVALANTLFFSAATAESKTKVALYLLITVAPFALVAPVIGPLLDRLQRGRRVALAVSFVGRGLLAVVMARHFGDWLLYPAALGSMVLSRSFGLLKAAATPRVLPPEMTLTKVNSRLAVFGLAAGGVVGAAAAGFAWALGSAGALYFTTAVCLVGAWLCLRIPAWVEVTEGEVQASLRDPGQEGVRQRRRREPLSRHVVVALWGNGTIRILTGFLTLFVAFVVKAQTEHSPWQQVVLLGAVGAAAGIGNIAGNALGARQHFGKPDQVILTCVGIVLSSAATAALVPGIATAVIVGLVGSTCSSLAKVCQDAVIQHDMSQESVASAFGRTETILQLSWTFGGALGVLMPPTYWIGFTVISGLLLVGAAQTFVAHRGGSLLPGLGGIRPPHATRPSPPSPQGQRP